MASKGKIVIKGLPELEAKLRRFPQVVEAAARKAVREETHEAAQDLRRLAPVLTGELRRSVQEEVVKKGLVGRAAITADYAEEVVNGTSDTPAHDFVTPVIAGTRRSFPKRLREIVRAELRNV